ncbi:nucleotide sugar dehydrogenase [Verrucomicrobiota bacterium]
MKDELLKRIEGRKCKVGVIGLGYVGLPLLIEFSKGGFPVLGFDTDSAKIEKLEKSESYIKHISADAISEAFKGDTGATTDFASVSGCDAILICVPTPLTKDRDPDLSYICQTAEQIGPHLRKGQLIVLESTTYPGTTEEVLVPILEKKSGLKAGEDFFVAFSPEREDPNNPQYSTSTIPKVVGGLTDDSLETAQALYNSIICETVPVSNCRAAEAAKLVENIFRSINIALVNELKMVFEKMDIDVWEVINAASTKPFGYMPFYPGPGLGGHCIPIDPFYLAWKAAKCGIPTKFIKLAGEINTHMPEYVIQKTIAALGEQGKALKDSHVLLVGLAYKKNVDDDRESPAYMLWENLSKQGAKVSYYDPYCPEIRPSRDHSDLAGIKSVSWQEVENGGFDVAIIVTAHDSVDHGKLVKALSLVVDTRGVCKPAENVKKA